MANPLPNEAQLYEQIKTEKITVHPFVWDTMYHYIGDNVSVINLIASYYIENNQPIPLDEARRILIYTNRIKEVVNKIVNPENIEDENHYFKRIKDENISLHPIIKEFFTHYMGNDVYIINLTVSSYLDPGYEEPIPINEAKKILHHTLTIRDFMDRLREATDRGEGY